MLKELLESLDKEVYTPEMIDAIQAQFNEAVETQAKEKAETQISEAVEKAIAELKETQEVELKEALEAKTIEIEAKADAYIAEALEAKTIEIEAKSREFISEKMNEMNESLDLFMNKVVEEFITETKEKLNESLKAEKADMIIEAFESMVTAGAIDVMKIAEDKDLSYADSKLAESVEKYDALMADFLSLKKENVELSKAGIISEMKEGLSLVESKKFETLAGMVPFSRDEKYTADLEVIKESVKGAVESTQTVITESVESTESKKLYGSHLV